MPLSARFGAAPFDIEMTVRLQPKPTFDINRNGRSTSPKYAFIHLAKLARRVAYSKVGAPATKRLVDFGHDGSDGFGQAMPRRSDRLDIVAYALHGPAAWPPLKVAVAAMLPRFQLAAVESEKVEPLASVPHIDHLRLCRVERQFKRSRMTPIRQSASRACASVLHSTTG
jgi:hypothetical protein